jgi:hypothetical protein
MLSEIPLFWAHAALCIGRTVSPKPDSPNRDQRALAESSSATRTEFPRPQAALRKESQPDSA